MGRARTMSRRRAQSGASSEESWQGQSLTASERAYMIRKAKEASVALVDHAHTLDGPVQWHYTGKFRGIQMYRGEGSYDRVGTAGTEFLCGVTTMMGTIEEVANYFDQQTTARMVAKKAEDVLDCGVLYSLVQGGPDNPFYRVSAKYQLYEGPSAFSRERDYCYLECQNTFRHASGRRGWVLSMHSIKLPSCPELDGVVRGSMYQSGYVFVEAEREGYMDVMHSLQINFKSTNRLPHFLLNSALKRRILSVVTISREIQTARMGRQTLLKKKDLMPKRARALCVNCSRKFSLFVRKTRCRVCGEVVCQPCAPQVMISTKRGPVKTRVCTKCYHLSAGDEYEPVGALPNPHNGVDPRRGQNETRYSDILQDQDNPDMYHEEDEDSMDEDGDEDGLEEQSDYSVFAASRFTDASRDSVATSRFGASRSNFESHFESHFEGSSQFGGTNSELDDSQYYDGGVSEDSFVSGVSGTSTSYWHGGNSATSSAMGWNQASSVKPTDGHIYDPQASTTSSNFYGASNYGSDFGASQYSANDEPAKRPGRYNAAAPIPEDEPTSHRGYTISPNASYNSSSEYNSTQGTNYNSTQSSNYNSTQVSDFSSTQGPGYNSTQVSDFKATQGTGYDVSPNASHASKTVSIQNLAKARSARYGIKSEFPPSPPPPPPLSPPPEEANEDEDEDSPLHLGALKTDNDRNPRDRKPKGIAARKMFTPLPPKEGRRETDGRPSSNRVPRVPRSKEFAAAAISSNKDSRASQASSRDSRGFGSTRSSAILEQMRRNRRQAPRSTPESEQSTAALKSLEEEHLNRMREIERMQEIAREKAARRSMASDASRSSMQNSQRSQRGVRSQSSRGSAARQQSDLFRRSARNSPPHSPPATKKQQDKFRRRARSSRSSRRSPPHSPTAAKSQDKFRRSARNSPPHSPVGLPASPTGPPPGSPPGPPPGSPPGAPPSMRGRRLPLNGSFNQRGNRSFGRQTDASSDFGNSQQLLSNRSNGAFANSGARSEDLMFNSQRSGFQNSKSNNSSFRGRRMDSSQTSSKGSGPSFGGSQRLDASQLSNAPTSTHPDDLAFDVSQLSVDKSKFSSSFAILETPGESADHVAMMERPSAERGSNSSSSFDEDLLNQSSPGMAHHISSIRARAPYQLPDEEPRPSDELRKRQEEHRRRMEELTRMAANHVGQDNVRDSVSTLGGLHDSSISLSSGNHFGDSTISSISSASSVDIDDVDFDFETRPLGRTKRSGTIPFALENLDQVPDVEDEEQSEGPDDSDTSFRLSEGPDEDDSEPDDANSAQRAIQKSVDPIDPKQPMRSYQSREEPIEHERANGLGVAESTYRMSEQSAEDDRSSVSDGVDSSYRMSEESVKHEPEQEKGHVDSSKRPLEESISDERQGGYINLTTLPSEKLVKHKREPATQANIQKYKLEPATQANIQKYKLEPATQASVQKHGRDSASEDVEPVHVLIEKFENMGGIRPYRPGEESVMRESEHDKPTYSLSEESVERDSEQGGRDQAYRPSEESVGRESEDDDANQAYRPSEGSVERESEHEDAAPPFRPSVEYMEHENEDDDAKPAYRPSEGSVKHESGHEEASPAYRSSEESVERDNEHEDIKAADRVNDTSIERDSEQVRAASPFSDISRERNREQQDAYRLTAESESEPEDADATYRLSGEPSTPPKGEFNSQSFEKIIGDASSLTSAKLKSATQEFNSPKAEFSNTMSINDLASPRDSSVSDLDEDLMNRPTNELFEMVRANRALHSADSPNVMEASHVRRLEASHVRRMDELNRIAQDHLGDRLSNLDEDKHGSSQRSVKTAAKSETEGDAVSDDFQASRKLSEVEGQYSDDDSDSDSDSARDSAEFAQQDLKDAAQEYQSPKAEFSNTMSINDLASTRRSSASDLDEDLMNRPTNELFEMVRANRALHSADSPNVMEASHVRRLEASHVRRMDELNRIAQDHLGDRLSNLDEDKHGSSQRSVKTAAKSETEGDAVSDDFQASRKLSEVEGQYSDDDSDSDSDSARDSAEFAQQDLKDAAQEYQSPKAEFSNTMSINDLASTRRSSASDLDEDLMNRPTNELFEMVRANRALHSADSPNVMEASHVRRLEASHVRRMDELNRIAQDHLGDRLSNLDEDKHGSSQRSVKTAAKSETEGDAVSDDFQASRKLSEVEGQYSDDDSDSDSDSARDSAEFAQQDLKDAAQEYQSPKAEFSNTMSINDLASTRRSSASDLDEDLMNRPTNELFEMVRANRALHSADSPNVMEASHVRRLEASHVRRMDELNRIAQDHLGDRLSNLDEDKHGSSQRSVKTAAKSETEGDAVSDDFQASRKLSEVEGQYSDDDSDSDSDSARDSAEFAQQDLKDAAQEYQSPKAEFSNTMSINDLASTRRSSASDLDEDLMNRPTNELFEMVRANRALHSADSPNVMEASHVRRLEASHVRRMDELNRIAQDHLGDRLSNLDEDKHGSSQRSVKTAAKSETEGDAVSDDFQASRKLSEVEGQYSDDDSDSDSDSARDSAEFAQQDLKDAAQEYQSPKAEFSNTMSINDLASTRRSSASDLDEDLMNRPTNELFEMVRANRALHSADSPNVMEASHVRRLEASHVRRMDELNRIAQDHLGDRLSNLDEDMLGSSYQPVNKAPKFQPQSSQLVLGEGGQPVDEFFASMVAPSGKLSQVDEQHADDEDDTRSPRDSGALNQGNVKSIPSIDEEGTAQQYSPARDRFSSSMSSSVMSEQLVSPRDSTVSDLDEDLMNRPTNELFEMVRANRALHSADSPNVMEASHVRRMEASHMRRMDELNRIAQDHLGDRLSNLNEDMLGSAYQPGRSLHPKFRDEEEEMRWRSSNVMQEAETKHAADMERLRRRIRQLEEECRESIASVLTPDEMDLSELDGEEPAVGLNGHQSYHGGRNFNPQSSFVSTSDLGSSVISEHAEEEEPMPARVLLEQIAKLTQLQHEMAEVDDEDDEEEYRERIKDQYRALRSIQAETQRERRSSSLSQRSSLSEENWV